MNKEEYLALYHEFRSPGTSAERKKEILSTIKNVFVALNLKNYELHKKYHLAYELENCETRESSLIFFDLKNEGFGVEEDDEMYCISEEYDYLGLKETSVTLTYKDPLFGNWNIIIPVDLLEEENLNAHELNLKNRKIARLESAIETYRNEQTKISRQLNMFEQELAEIKNIF